VKESGNYGNFKEITEKFQSYIMIVIDIDTRHRGKRKWKFQ